MRNSIELGETQLWVVPLQMQPTVIRDLAVLLSAEELSRADRFITTELRHRFIACRGALRQLLAANRDCEAGEVVIHARFDGLGTQRSGSCLGDLHLRRIRDVTCSLRRFAVDRPGQTFESDQHQLNQSSAV